MNTIFGYFKGLGDFISNPYFMMVIMGLFLIITFLIFLLKAETYYKYLLSFRKGFYLLFTVLIAMAMVDSLVTQNDWQLLLQLVAAAIFLDLAMFQTPGISKIWNTEFDRGEYTLKTLSENTRLLRNNSAKALAFHKSVAFAHESLGRMAPPDSWEGYRERLFHYFSGYIEKLKMEVQLLELVWEDETEKYSQSMESGLTDILNYHGIQSPKEDVRERWIKRLTDGDEVKINSDLDETIVIMPYFGPQYSFLLSVVGKGEIEADEVDAMNLINMSYILEWWIS